MRGIAMLRNHDIVTPYHRATEHRPNDEEKSRLQRLGSPHFGGGEPTSRNWFHASARLGVHGTTHQVAGYASCAHPSKGEKDRAQGT
jgi:hypothetical protein